MPTPISISEINEGIERSVENASRYLEDALFLFQNGKYPSSILLSMLSYEESGKVILLLDYKMRKKEITRTQWIKKFCSHTTKNITSRRAIWQDADFTPRIPNYDKALARFDQEWKQVFAYVDYDFRNQKWTTPLVTESFGLNNVKSFCINAMTHSKEALESVIRRLEATK